MSRLPYREVIVNRALRPLLRWNMLEHRKIETGIAGRLATRPISIGMRFVKWDTTERPRMRCPWKTMFKGVSLNRCVERPNVMKSSWSSAFTQSLLLYQLKNLESVQHFLQPYPSSQHLLRAGLQLHERKLFWFPATKTSIGRNVVQEPHHRRASKLRIPKQLEPDETAKCG